jgi:GH24 family phage-related lysozyme (muramidase)
MKKPSKKTIELLHEFEVGGGETYYNAKLKRFTWPGVASGPTIGIGVDCGYYSPEELEKIFNFLPKKDLDLVKAASGKTGAAGKTYTSVLRKAGIEVSWEQAQEIFETLTWPKFARATERAFPGVDKLAPDAYGALVSLVFNRGTSMAGERRKEMRAIRDLVPKKDYRGIARELRKMKRIWEGEGADGLLRRRDAEAALVENCV